MADRTTTAFDRVARSVYTLVANEEDDRVCRDIPEEACRVVPTNVARIVAALSLTRLGDALGNPKTTLAWLMTFVGAPPALIGLLVPIRESGSLIPQLVIATWVRRMPVRKWVWVTGSVLQAVAMAGVGLFAALLEGAAAGGAMLACLAVFSLARGLCSVSHKDVLGKTVPRARRGRVSGIATAVAGVLVAAVGVALLAARRSDLGVEFYGGLVAVAGLLWLFAAAVYAGMDEAPGATEGGGDAARAAIGRAGLLMSDRDFRVFVASRGLLLGSALVAPYYVALAQRASDGAPWMLGLLVLAGGLASSLSAPFWGRMADRSSRRTMVWAGAAAGGLGVAVFALETSLEAVPVAIYPVAFLALAVAHAGVRLGRKTYVVDMASGNRRTDYVAVGNSAIGVLLLLVGGATAAAGSTPTEWIVLGLSFMTLLGALSSLRMREIGFAANP